MEKKIIINIGRQFGGGGLGVAHELGKKLGIPVYDKELIKKAAQDSGFSKEVFEESDEKKRFFSLSSIFANGFSDRCSWMISSKRENVTKISRSAAGFFL